MSEVSLQIKLPSLEELLKRGVHFGHKESKWHPNMKPFIYTSRNGIHVIDLVKTQEQLAVALTAMKQAAYEGHTILFVGTKRAVKVAVKAAAVEAHMPHVAERWLGGTITNFDSIYGLIKNLRTIEERQAQPDYSDKYTKKERLDESEEKARLEKLIGGIRSMNKLPDMLFVVDVRQDDTAVREAQRRSIPIVALVDTNVNPKGIVYPIPANDDSIKSVELILQLASQAVQEGLNDRSSGTQAEMQSVADADANLSL